MVYLKGQAQVSELLDNYDSQIGLYRSFCEAASGLIGRLLDAERIAVHSISFRCKARNSLEKKVKKKSRYNSLSDITDLVGVRIITHYSDDVDKIAKLISDEFDIDASNSIDKRAALDPDRFGYLSLHYIASLRGDRSGLKEYSAYSGLKLEIQIRSILQHTWAEIEHDIGYKNEIEVPDPIRRRFSRLASLLELADEEFISIREEIRKYAESLDSNLMENPSGIGIDLVSFEKIVTKDSFNLSLVNELVNISGSYITDSSSEGPLIARLATLGVNKVDQLLELLKVHANDIKNMFLKMKDLPDPYDDGDLGPISPSTAVFFLCHVLAAKLGSDGALRYVQENGWFDEPGGEEFVALLENFFSDKSTDLKIDF